MYSANSRHVTEKLLGWRRRRQATSLAILIAPRGICKRSPAARHGDGDTRLVLPMVDMTWMPEHGPGFADTRP